MFYKSLLTIWRLLHTKRLAANLVLCAFWTNNDSTHAYECTRSSRQVTKNQQTIVFGTLSLGNAFIATINNELH